MKKTATIMTTMLLIFTLSGCEKSVDSNIDKTYANSKEETEEKRVHITDDLYESWLDQIYMDPIAYEGAIIRVEGIYGGYYSETDNKYHNMVYRLYKDDSACYDHTHEEGEEHEHDDKHVSQDEMYGFEFDYNGEMPKENDWIEVEGILEVHKIDGIQSIKLKATSVKSIN